MTVQDPNDSGSLSPNENGEKNRDTSFGRRAVLTGLAGLGLLSTVDRTAANTTGTTLEFGGSYSGDPSGACLELEHTATTDTFEFGFIGRSNAKKGRGVAGFAQNTSGKSVALFGRNDSTDGSGIRAISDATSGFTKGIYGTAKSPNGRGIYAVNSASSGDAYGAYCQSNSESGIGVYGLAKASSGTNIGVKGETNSSGGYGVYTPDDAKVDGKVEVGGDIQVSGVKNFVQTVSTDAGPKQVKYTSVEAGEPQTETSDVTEMEDGIAIVELPDHFGMVTTSEERITVQITPYCNEKVHPQVTDRSTERIVVKDFGDGPDDYTFAYTVKGIRRGFEDQEVVSNP